MSRALLPALVAAGALALGACGSGDEPDPPAPERTPAATTSPTSLA